MVKQQSLAGFDVKLTPMGSWSVPTGILIVPHKPAICCNLKFPCLDAISTRSSSMEHSEDEPRLRERKHLRPSNLGL